MYRIIQRYDEFANLPKAYLCLIIGFFLAIAVFNFLVVPLHNWVKYYLVRKFGDYSAYEEGWVTLHPRPNIHIVGILTSVVLNVGFAAPTYFDTDRFRRPKIYTFLISLSGVVTYVVSFGVMFFVYAALNVNNVFDVSLLSADKFTQDLNFLQCIYYPVFSMFYFVAQISLYSAIFNLIPAFPLDMGDALYEFMPTNWQDNLRNNDLAISLALFVVAFLFLGASKNGATDGLITKIGRPVMENYLSFTEMLFGK